MSEIIVDKGIHHFNHSKIDILRVGEKAPQNSFFSKIMSRRIKGEGECDQWSSELHVVHWNQWFYASCF